MPTSDWCRPLLLLSLAVSMQAQAAGGHDHAHGHHQHGEHHAAQHMQVGQAAFGAIQEIVRRLEADPRTDWSKVDLEALRQHLIDMHEVTLHARVEQRPIDGGLEMRVGGEGRVLEAVRRMVPAHARAMNGQQGWRTEARELKDAVLLRVTASEPGQVAKIRGLGFIGFMASGDHHQAHHLDMATGCFPH